MTLPGGLKETLNYNEKKVQKGVAACIGGGNILLDPEKMNFYQKMKVFEDRNARNERATTKTMHISLNFDPSEKFTKEQLNEMADLYMQKIGFGGQPYLVYEHKDAGHPHVHVLTSTIGKDGKRLSTHNIGRNQSEKARKEIEERYGLVKAEHQKQLNIAEIKPVDVNKVLYGKSETRRSITNVLNAVITKYNYTSLPELNAILSRYNVMADRGSKEGVMYKKGGLIYRVLDSKGAPIGVPIKASSINNKPTLKTIEKRGEQNVVGRAALKAKIKDSLDEALLAKPRSLEELTRKLESQQVYTVIRRGADGRPYGITFVDGKNKSVFNGSDIGKQYSIGGLLGKMLDTSPKTKEKPENSQPKHLAKQLLLAKHKDLALDRPSTRYNILQQLMTSNPLSENTPSGLLKKKRKKKRKSLGL